MRPEFRKALEALMKKLKAPETCRVKMINGRALTSSMLLGMALEYVDAINNQEIPVVLNCFERVVQVESRRFTEKLFEDVCMNLNQECDEALMPYEDEQSFLNEANNEEEQVECQLDQILERHIAYADKRISEKLSEVVGSVDTLIDLRNDFEDRVRSYYKEIRRRNRDISYL